MTTIGLFVSFLSENLVQAFFSRNIMMIMAFSGNLSMFEQLLRFNMGNSSHLYLLWSFSGWREYPQGPFLCWWVVGGGEDGW